MDNGKYDPGLRTASHRVLYNIEAGKYDPKFHYNMTTDQRTAEIERVRSAFKSDVLREFEMENPLGERLFGLAWDAMYRSGYDAVLTNFYFHITQDVA